MPRKTHIKDTSYKVSTKKNIKVPVMHEDEVKYVRASKVKGNIGAGNMALLKGLLSSMN